MIKISVIVPVYNMEIRLKKCIDSLVNQTLKDIELIIVNDGSKDNSLKIIKEYQKTHNNIKIIDKKNGGIGAARNDGIKIATGEYIAFVDSDDYIELDMFEKMYKTIKKEKACIVVCNYKTFNEMDNNIIYNNIVAETNITTFDKNPEMLNKIHYMPWNKLYKKELFDKTKYPINVKYEDLNTIIKVFAKAKKIVPVNDYLYNYLLNPTGETLTVNKKILDILIILEDIVVFFNNKKSKVFHNQLQLLCVNKVIHYIILSYNLENKNDSIQFVKMALKFLNKNFKGWRINNLKNIKNIKNKILFIIRSSLVLNKILINFKKIRRKK